MLFTVQVKKYCYSRARPRPVAESAHSRLTPRQNGGPPVAGTKTQQKISPKTLPVLAGSCLYGIILAKLKKVRD